jgi:hypothetical protein
MQWETPDEQTNEGRGKGASTKIKYVATKQMDD